MFQCNKTLVILGQNSNIAKEIVSQLVKSNLMSSRVISYEYIAQFRTSQFGLSSFLSELSHLHPGEEIYIVNCIGVTNPRLNAAMLLDINCEFNLQLARAVKETEVNLITIGTIMENFPELCFSNPYLYSKYLSFSKLEELRIENHLHLRLHTLYGGMTLHPHMFLGQLQSALKLGSDFLMTHGQQLREYHHIEDDVSLLIRSVFSGIYGIVEISSGMPVRLLELAQAVYSELLPNRKVIADLRVDTIENLNHVFPKLSSFDGNPVTFRDTRSGVIEYLRKL